MRVKMVKICRIERLFANRCQIVISLFSTTTLISKKPYSTDEPLASINWIKYASADESVSVSWRFFAILAFRTSLPLWFVGRPKFEDTSRRLAYYAIRKFLNRKGKQKQTEIAFVSCSRANIVLHQLKYSARDRKGRRGIAAVRRRVHRRHRIAVVDRRPTRTARISPVQLF